MNTVSPCIHTIHYSKFPAAVPMLERVIGGLFTHQKGPLDHVIVYGDGLLELLNGRKPPRLSAYIGSIPWRRGVLPQGWSESGEGLLFHASGVPVPILVADIGNEAIGMDNVLGHPALGYPEIVYNIDGVRCTAAALARLPVTAT